MFLRIDSPQDGGVHIVGIHRGQFPASGLRVFAPIGNVHLDLGPNNTWDTCDPTFNC